MRNYSKEEIKIESFEKEIINFEEEFIIENFEDELKVEYLEEGFEVKFIENDESYLKHYSARIDAIDDGIAFLLASLPQGPFLFKEELRKFLHQQAEDCKEQLRNLTRLRENDINYFQNSLDNYKNFVVSMLHLELGMKVDNIIRELDRAEQFALALKERDTICSITKIDDNNNYVAMIDQPLNPFSAKIKQELKAIKDSIDILDQGLPAWFKALKEYEKCYVKKFLELINLDDLGKGINALSSKLRIIPVPANYGLHTLILKVDGFEPLTHQFY